MKRPHKKEMPPKASPAPAKPSAVAAAPAPAAIAAPVQQFSATNGKWTIGGLNQVDVYKLILNNGLA